TIECLYGNCASAASPTVPTRRTNEPAAPIRPAGTLTRVWIGPRSGSTASIWTPAADYQTTTPRSQGCGAPLGGSTRAVRAGPEQARQTPCKYQILDKQTSRSSSSAGTSWSAAGRGIQSPDMVGALSSQAGNRARWAPGDAP